MTTEIGTFAADFCEANSVCDRTDVYVDDDGLFRCQVCHKPVTMRIACFPKPVRCLCDCEIKEEERKIESFRNNSIRSKVESMRRRSNLDGTTFNDLDVNDANEFNMRVAKRYVEKFDELYRKNQGLLMYGDVGTGKTALATCIGNALADKLVTVFATSFVKVLQQNRSYDAALANKAFMDDIRNAKLLILDDYGAERTTDFALEIMYSIIDERYRAKKPMIVTTNLSLEQMLHSSDERYRRLNDRILEVCYPMKFSGTSWRMKEAKERFEDMKKGVS